MTELATLSEQLHSVRQSDHISQSDLASRANVTRQTISKIENGQAGNVLFGTVAAVADALGYQIELRPKVNRIDEVSSFEGSQPDSLGDRLSDYEEWF